MRHNDVPDVSVIVPTTGRDPESLARALDSVAAQELGIYSAEIVLIPNGEHQAVARDLARSWAEDHPDVSVRIFTADAPGAGRARNIGLATARGEFLTFLDDDDELAPGYLRAGLNTAMAAGEHTVAVLPIQDFRADGTPATTTPLGRRIESLPRTPIPAADVPWLLGFNASKVFPRSVGTAFRYPEELRSGEDVAYFLQFLAFEDLKIQRVEASSDRAAYRRHLSQDSVSRQATSYDFNVTQRLECAAALRDIPVAHLNRHGRTAQMRSQYNFVLRFLGEHPEAVESVVRDLATLGLHDFPWEEAPDTAPDTLVISYCFPPFADPAGYVSAKQIARNKTLVDVISADMGTVRSVDESSRGIASPYIREHFISPVPPSFSSWPEIATFGRNAVRRAGRLKPAGYKKVRSRALWSGSHVAAALYKRKFPGAWWSAEFSDPMRFGVTGAPRNGFLTSGRVTGALKSMLRGHRDLTSRINTHFDLVEFVTMVHADEVIFTNENQRTVMLADYPDDIRNLVLEKSVIAAQPEPLPEHVALGTAVDAFSTPEVTHIAYFGSFYSSRGIGEILTAIGEAPREVRDRLRLHVFTSKPGAVVLQARELELLDVVEAHQALNYLDFLATAAQADVLFVSDAQTSDYFEVNPFLPSKVSDYLGVGVPVWGHVEPESSLSGLELRYESIVNDEQSIQDVLVRISTEGNRSR